MKKLCLLNIFFAIIFTACGGMKATVPDDIYAKQTQGIVEKWIAAYKNKDANALLSLYSDDLTWKLCTGATCDTALLSIVKDAAPVTFAHPSFKVNIQSYVIVNDGVYAVLQGTYQDATEDAHTPTPATVILVIKNEKISEETWYYPTN